MQLSEQLRNDPSKIHKSIRQRRTASSNISRLTVGSHVYSGDNVPDGFFASLSALKDPDMTSIMGSSSFSETLRDYTHILKLAQAGGVIPSIELYQSIELLYSLKADVNDLFSITAAHFINAGAAGLRHFHLLMTALIANLNNASLSEMNDIWAMVLQDH